MTSADVIRERLVRERTEVLAQVSALDGEFAAIVAASRDSNSDDEHDPEGQTIGFERTLVHSFSQRSAHHLAEIDGALARLEDGTYGICAGCGEAIAEARLEARPTARQCISCASK